MEYVFDWYLVYRNTEDMRDLVKGNFPLDTVLTNEIENGTMKFIEISL
jgi:hypothetical protein